MIEAWGTGIQRIRREVEEHGGVRLVLQEVGNAFQVQFVKTELTPEVTPEATPEVRLASAIDGEMRRGEIMERLDLKDEEHFRKVYLIPALEAGLIERIIPDKPRSSNQKYRLTEKGRSAVGGA